VLRRLEPSLRRRFPRVDTHWISEAAHDAVLEAIKRNRRHCDPCPSLALLYTIAWRRLANRLRAERRHRAAEAKGCALALANSYGLYVREEGRLRAEEQIRCLLTKVRPAERNIFALMLSGERATARYAEVLGLEAEPVELQRDVVKRVKDRLIRRLIRAIKASHPRTRQRSSPDV
jgi:DNA-directed RNA polymerase specialized sigma24 family protein